MKQQRECANESPNFSIHIGLENGKTNQKKKINKKTFRVSIKGVHILYCNMKTYYS
jgi:hypothetical protein